MGILGLMFIGVILTSPLLVSLFIVVIPRRFYLLSILLCVCEIIIGAAVWWFFWGDGIGRELHLSSSWIAVVVVASLIPTALFVLRLFGPE
jgi:hypothetical protein